MAATRSEKIDMAVTDRISSLPRTLIDDIVAFLPIRDAARTSVLSRKWRYIWAENPQLVIDEQFFGDIKEERSTAEFPQHYVNLVNGLLLQRHAPILKFILEVPLLPSSEYSNVDLWMLFLSRQGMKELTLANSNPVRYKIPSPIFSCPTLENITISSCIFKAPPNPTSNEIFKTLTSLDLEKITFEPSSVLVIPKLFYLRLAKCQGICHFNISAREIHRLLLTDNDGLELSFYVNCTNLCYAYIGLSSGVVHNSPSEKITGEKLFSSWPQLTQLVLDASFLKYIAAGVTDALKLQSTGRRKLHNLVIYRISYDLEEMVCILCLIRAFFNLHKLEIWAAWSIHEDMKVVEYLEDQRLLNPSNIQELAIVKMINFSGSRAELLFVKLLIANGPFIERMYITENKNLSSITRLQTSNQLLRFPRASPTTEIIFEVGYNQN